MFNYLKLKKADIILLQDDSFWLKESDTVELWLEGKYYNEPWD